MSSVVETTPMNGAESSSAWVELPATAKSAFMPSFVNTCMVPVNGPTNPCEMSVNGCIWVPTADTGRDKMVWVKKPTVISSETNGCNSSCAPGAKLPV